MSPLSQSTLFTNELIMSLCIPRLYPVHCYVLCRQNINLCQHSDYRKLLSSSVVEPSKLKKKQKMRHNALTWPRNAGNPISEYLCFKTFCTPLEKTAFRQWSLSRVPSSELVANSKASALLATTHVFLHSILLSFLSSFIFFYCC